MDLSPEHIAEDLSVNDQESIIEIIVEKVLGFENAISEYDDVDSNELNGKTTSISLDTLFTAKASIPSPSLSYYKSSFGNYIQQISSGYYKLLTPPPKA